MFKKFYPKEYVESAYRIDYDKIFQDGYHALIFDIDNTLVRHGAKADQHAIALFQKLKKIGFKICVLSNNKEPRVKAFCDAISVSYIYNAHKPSVRSYQRAINKLGSNVKNTIFIGDQIFTDIYGANRTGLYSILVKPIHPKEEIQIVLKRYFEKVVLFFYLRQKR